MKAEDLHKQQERQDAIEFLREYIPKGSRIYVNITHTSKSNMSWSATVSVVRFGGLMRVTREVAKAIEWNIRKGELKGGGVGSDRASEIAYALGKALYDDPYSIKPDYV